MDCCLLSFIFSFRAAISILLLLRQLLLATILFTASLFKQVIQWLLFLTCLFFTTRLGQFIWLFLLMVLCLVFIVPIVFHSFYKSVYDFGPKHCKQTFWESLTQPVPEIKFEGCLGKSADFDSLQQCRFNHKPIGCKLQQNRILSSKLVTRSTTMLVHDCPMTSWCSASLWISDIHYFEWCQFHWKSLGSVSVFDANDFLLCNLSFLLPWFGLQDYSLSSTWRFHYGRICNIHYIGDLQIYYSKSMDTTNQSQFQTSPSKTYSEGDVHLLHRELAHWPMQPYRKLTEKSFSICDSRFW